MWTLRSHVTHEILEKSLPENNIAKQCLQLSKEMADKNRTGLLQKIDQFCIEYNSSSITLDVNNVKRFTSHIKQNIRKALTAHQLKLIDTNRKLNLYAFFRKDIKTIPITELL